MLTREQLGMYSAKDRGVERSTKAKLDWAKCNACPAQPGLLLYRNSFNNADHGETPSTLPGTAHDAASTKPRIFFFRKEAGGKRVRIAQMEICVLPDIVTMDSFENAILVRCNLGSTNCLLHIPAIFMSLALRSQVIPLTDCTRNARSPPSGCTSCRTLACRVLLFLCRWCTGVMEEIEEHLHLDEIIKIPKTLRRKP